MPPSSDLTDAAIPLSAENVGVRESFSYRGTPTRPCSHRSLASPLLRPSVGAASRRHLQALVARLHGIHQCRVSTTRCVWSARVGLTSRGAVPFPLPFCLFFKWRTGDNNTARPPADDEQHAATASAAQSLHRQIVELHRTGRRWKERQLDLDEGVDARAREIGGALFDTADPGMPGGWGTPVVVERG